MQNKNLIYSCPTASFKQVFVYCVCFYACGCKEKEQNQLFTSLSLKKTGIDFSNNIDETKMPDEVLNEFAYMGDGIGIIDLNNDGLKDIFFCGNQVSSKLYLNKGNYTFTKFTDSSGIKKNSMSNGAAYVDLDNDGDLDLVVNNINRPAIGAKIKVTFKENNTERSVYRDVNSGGSFGANPLLQHVGIGQATAIEKIEVTWPVTGHVQVFKNSPIDTNIKIKEDDSKFTTYKLARLDFTKVAGQDMHHH